MKKYIGVKAVEAKPMRLVEAEDLLQRKIGPGNPQGYLVRYPDGYESWSPKKVFDDAYMEVGPNNTIIEQNVNDFIKSYEVTQWGDKTTVVHATLANGFIVSDSSSCVDPANFNLDIGASVCKDRIRNKVWAMLGFVLQCGVSGMIAKRGE